MFLKAYRPQILIVFSKLILAGFVLIFATLAHAENLCRARLSDSTIKNERLNNVLSPEDVTNTTSQTRAWKTAIELKKSMRGLSAKARNEASVPYFESQLKQSLGIYRELRASGFRFKKYLPESFHGESESFIAAIHELVKFEESAEEVALQMVKEKKLTMGATTLFLLSVEALRTIKIDLESGAYKELNITNWNAITYNINMYKSAARVIQEHIDQGVLLLPTFAKTDIPFFSYTWPLVRPIGFSEKPLVNFDGLKDVPALNFPFHDLTMHAVFTDIKPRTLLLMENVESRFFSLVFAKDPRLTEFAKFVFFQATHESEWIYRYKDMLEETSPKLTRSQVGNTFWRESQMGEPYIVKLFQKESPEVFKRLAVKMGLQDSSPSFEELQKIGKVLSALLTQAVQVELSLSK